MTELAPVEWWGVAEAAFHCGIRPVTWRGYVARGRAPQPDDPDEGAPPQRRRPRWRAETVTAWQASRPRAPRHHEMTPAELRALADRIESEECTGIAASWCPTHGRCTCPRDPSGARVIDHLIDSGCALHGAASNHAAAIAQECQEDA